MYFNGRFKSKVGRTVTESCGKGAEQENGGTAEGAANRLLKVERSYKGEVPETPQSQEVLKCQQVSISGFGSRPLPRGSPKTLSQGVLYFRKTKRAETEQAG